MKIEKAIEILMDIQSDWEDGEEYEAFNTALKALEKQIPKKPISDGSNIRYTPVYSCPKCGNRITGTGIAEYCYHCGQKLHWEVEDEH